jgi:fibro-slime domain-containing protein
MRSGRVLFFLAAALFANVVACAGVKPGAGVNPDGATGGGGSNFDGGRPDIPTIEVGNLSLCGNGMMDPNEQCDDGNKTAGDGCSAICQIPAGWSCSGWPSVCTMAGVCGDSILGASEACDDGNTAGNDGCAADCKKVDPGYECRVPGRKCVPTCGDGMKIGMEQCDDANAANDDGCSATCQIEPGASCTGTPSVCKASICGNGMKEGNEGCDCGTSITGPWPTGCKGPNGLFFGDASGCSKTCTQEPSCRTGTTTQACAISCGNGAIEMGEGCDDGNLDDGDGCSKTCVLEGGFMCSAVMQDDAAACTDAANGGMAAKCLQLPIILRDFKSEKETGGHPDFFYLGATVANPVSITGVQGQTGATTFSKRYCVPNSSGPAKKNDSANRCWDLAQATLGANGKPVFNMTRTGGTNCDCQFIDWSHDGNGGHVPGITMAQSPTIGLTYTDGASGHPMYRGPAPVVTSAATFGQWWTDGTWTAGGTHSVGMLEMKAIGGGQYQFSSQVNSVTGGFFPLDPPAHGFPLYTVAPAGPGTPPQMVGTEAMLCNLWPYWFTSTGFGAMNNCRGDQYLFPPSLIPPDTTGVCPGGMNCNGKWYVGQQGWYHDSWFTDEARYLFTHTGAFNLQFYGDDDMFIFINGKLVIDLGGVHQRLPGRVDVNAAGMATIIEGGSLDITGTTILPCASTSLDPYTGVAFNLTTGNDGNGHMNCTNTSCDCRNRTVDLGLQMGRTYEIAVFGADRHPTESNYQLTLSGFATQKSNCMPRCGDGKQTGAEECDCGDSSANMSTDASCGGKINDGSYGGCTTMCKYGPYCGDGVPDAANGEECDLGSRMNNVTYGNKDGCAPGCKFPHFCGDGKVDEAENEQCDLGMGNGATGAPCTKDCKVCVDCQ